MKAFILDRYKKGQLLRLGDVPDPVPAADEVLVDIHATALNQLDARIRDGAFEPILPYKPLLVIGHDLAGVVLAVGAGVRRFKPGDAVLPVRAMVISAPSPNGSRSRRPISRSNPPVSRWWRPPPSRSSGSRPGRCSSSARN